MKPINGRIDNKMAVFLSVSQNKILRTKRKKHLQLEPLEKKYSDLIEELTPKITASEIARLGLQKLKNCALEE